MNRSAVFFGRNILLIAQEVYLSCTASIHRTIFPSPLSSIWVSDLLSHYLQKSKSTLRDNVAAISDWVDNFCDFYYRACNEADQAACPQHAGRAASGCAVSTGAGWYIWEKAAGWDIKIWMWLCTERCSNLFSCIGHWLNASTCCGCSVLQLNV